MIEHRFQPERRPLRKERSPAVFGPSSAPKKATWRCRPAAALCLLAALLAGCSNLGPPPTPRYAPPATVSSDNTFAKGALSPEQEVEYLSRANTPPALLRRAWLELELGRTQAALDSTARVIFTEPKPSAHVESFARYLRGKAYQRQGANARGNRDLEQAQRLALDPGLQRRLRDTAPRRAAPRAGRANRPSWGSLAIQPRSAWSPKRENRSNLDPMQRPSKVTIHHSAMYFRSTSPRDAAAQIGKIQREHMKTRGYGDIGYHFLIDPSGRIWEGRQLRWQGAHAHGNNNIGNIGVCLLGNFMRQRDGQGPTKDQVQAMEQLVVSLTQRYRMRGDVLFCHSDFRSTACPGQRMTPIVRQLARQLRNRGYVAAAEEEDE